MISFENLLVICIFVVPLEVMALTTLLSLVYGSSVKAALRNTIKESLVEVYRENARR